MLGLKVSITNIFNGLRFPSWLKAYFDNTSSANTTVDDKCVENRAKFYNKTTREQLVANRLGYNIGNTSENYDNTLSLVTSLMDETPVIFPTTNSTGGDINFFVLGDSLTAYIKRRDRVIMSICAENEKISLDEVDTPGRQYFQEDSQYGDYQGDDVEIAHDLRLYTDYSLIRDSDLDFPTSRTKTQGWYNDHLFPSHLKHYGIGGSSAEEHLFILNAVDQSGNQNIAQQPANNTSILWYLDFSNELQGFDGSDGDNPLQTISTHPNDIQTKVDNAIDNVIAVIEAAQAKNLEVVYTIPPPYRLEVLQNDELVGDEANVRGNIYNERQAIFLGYADRAVPFPNDGTIVNGSGTAVGSNFNSIIEYLDAANVKYVYAFDPLLTYDTNRYASKQEAYIAGEIEIDPKYTFDDDWHPNAAAFSVVKDQIYPKFLEIINS